MYVNKKADKTMAPMREELSRIFDELVARMEAEPDEWTQERFQAALGHIEEARNALRFGTDW